MTEGKLRKNWTEIEEKFLVEAVNWVNQNFSQKDILTAMGGKWAVVRLRLERQARDEPKLFPSGIPTERACNTRFFDIKKREKKQNDNGQEIIVFNDVDFVQESLTPDQINQSRLQYLESEIATLKNNSNKLDDKLASLQQIVDALYNSFNSFFNFIGVQDNKDQS